MTVEDQIFKIVSEISIPRFFITVEFSSISMKVPEDIEKFLLEKHEAIQNGVTGRKFIYQKEGWRLVFTFFPTDHVVDERYALKNKVLKKR